jgi:hypothetical protein
MKLTRPKRVVEPPQLGDQRLVRRFAWLPTHVIAMREVGHGEGIESMLWAWLEEYSSWERYECIHPGGPLYGWVVVERREA